MEQILSDKSKFKQIPKDLTVTREATLNRKLYSIKDSLEKK